MKQTMLVVLSLYMVGILYAQTPVSEITVTPLKAQNSIRFNMGTAVNPEGTSLSMDSRSILMDGKPIIPVMGELHFARVPESEWRRELLKMKAGGINIVASYIFWIHHEEIEQEYDWSSQRNLGKFVELCDELGLPVILRIGPWCHGEVRHGGFPSWMVESGIKLRDNNESYLKKVHGWYQAVFDQVDGKLWKDGGAVIGIQLENEYRGSWEHLMTLKTMAQKIGFDVPIYTRTGWPALKTPATFGEIIPLYGDYSDGFWDRTLDEMPGDYAKSYLFRNFRNSTVIATEQLPKQDDTDKIEDLAYPYFTCELGGGMMTSYHRRINIAPMDVYAMTLVRIGSGSNLPGYYMYHGGTNPEGKLSYLNEARTTSYTNHNDLPIKTYDFQAPIGEFGQINPHYHLLRRLHLFLADFGAELSQMNPFFPEKALIDPKEDTELRWNVRSDGHSGYVFVNNYQRLKDLTSKSGIRFTINLPEGKFQFPQKTITIPSGSAFFMPFNVQIGGADLVYATAQPIAQIENNGIKTFFFSEIDGIPAEFVWKNNINIEYSESAPQTENGNIRFSDIPASTQVALRFSDKNNQQIQIVLIKDKESLGLWKGYLAGEERIFLTDNLLTCDGNEIVLEESDEKPFNISIYPVPKILSQKKKELSGTQNGVFTAYEIDKNPTARLTIDLNKVQEAGPLRQIEKDSNNIIKQPEDADFDNAAIWKLSVKADNYTNSDQDIYLQIPYVGDVARIYLDDQLLTDNFYNGKQMLLGLKRYSPNIYKRELTIKVLPFQKNAPIYLQRGNEIDFKGVDSSVDLPQVTAYEKQQVILIAK